MSSRKEFVHLHVHSHNSMLDGFSTQDEIAAACKAMGSRAFALTDHGYVSGLVAAQKAADDHDIKFIPGVETYLSNDNTAKETRMLKKYPELSEKQRAAENDTFHMLLLATNPQGLRNVYQLSSEGATHGSHGRNAKRVTTEHLERFHDGLIATSGCLSSRVSVHLLRDEYQLALERAALERDIFGAENYYIEIQNHGIDKQLKILGQQRQLAVDLGLPLVATNDSHYTYRHDAETHDHMLAINSRQGKGGGGILAPDRFCFDGEEHYLKSADEMFSLFPEDEFPGACSNTVEIAERVEDKISATDGSLLIPEFEYEEFGYDSADDMLRDRVMSGLNELLDGDIPDRYIEQMEFELNVIRNMGIQSYFLIVAAIMQFCRENGIYVGPGRGSAAGSVVVYGLHITKVDPIRHDLIFSRFLNAGRTDSMPDIDVDIESGRRHEVVEYMARRWGSDRVVNINTLQTFKAKSALKKVGAVHEVNKNGFIKNYDKEATEAASKIDSIGDLHLKVMLADEPPHSDDAGKQKELNDEWNSGSALREYINSSSDNEIAHVAELAASLERRNFTNGIHPAGVLITPGPVRDYFPIRRAKSKSEDPNWDLLDVCQFDCSEVNQLNGLKMDLLALKNLTVLEATVQKIQRDLGEDIDLDSIPLDDPDVYKMLQKGDSNGVFQIESSGMKELMRKVRPTSFDDISALIALFRPGPMGMDSHNIYADRKNGRAEVEYFHEDAREALQDTYGLVVYQEQVMRLSQKFAGFSEKEADDFRKAMGKKKKSVMEAMHADFVQRVADNGYTEQLGRTIWDTVEPFAGYAFNKAHSVSYGYITYQTAWLKVHYYPQFVGAFIDVFPKRSSSMSSEAISRGYNVGAPDVNRSFVDSTTRDSKINIGFNRVASFGDEAAQRVVDEREKNGPFDSIVDFCARTGTKKNSVESLIRAGAFDSIEGHTDRQTMIDSIDDIVATGKRFAERRRNASAFGGRSLLDFGGMDNVKIDDPMRGFDFGSLTTSSRQRRIFERDSIGFFVGEHPFQDFADQIDELRESVPAMENALSTAEVMQNRVTGRGNFFGVLTEFSESTSKRGNAMTKFVIDCGDQSDVSAMVMGHNHFDEDDLMSLVLVEGVIEEDQFLASQDQDAQQQIFGEDDEDIKSTTAQATQFYARFGFGAKPVVVKRSADDGVNNEAMNVEGRTLSAAAKKSAKQSAKSTRESRSTVHKSTVRKREERSADQNSYRRDSTGREGRNRESRENIDALRNVRRQIAKRKSAADKKYEQRAFCVKFNSGSEERSELVFQYVLLWLNKYSDQEGRRAHIVINSERIDTGLLLTDSGMTRFRKEMRKLATLAQTSISIGEC